MGSLTQFQKSIITGSVLGDGYLRIVPGRKDAFLEINHAFAAREYVDWKYKQLGNLVAGKPKIRRGNGGRVAYRFYTRQHPELTELKFAFYSDGTKVVPDQLELDEWSLAVWYMDDGSKCRDSLYLNTQQFALSDQKKLLRKLDKLGLAAALNRDKCYWRIRFYARSVPLFKKLVEDKLIPSMRYKLG